MLLHFFKELGYKQCGYLQRLLEFKGSVGRELWYNFVCTDEELCNRPGPLVYIWFYKYDIIYVGETSLTIKKRITNGHFGGFRGGSYSGVEKQKQLLQLEDEKIFVLVAFDAFFLKYLHEQVKKVDINNFNKMITPFQSDMLTAKYLEEKSIIAMFNPKLNKK